MKYYAGIGSRATPVEVCRRMTRLSTILERKGYTLRSGRAKRADQAFEEGVRNPQNAEIFLPSEDIPIWCTVFTQHFHPNPSALEDFHWKLMNRNAMQVLGRDGDTPIEFVACWTKDGKASGGTGHAMRIAKYFNIPIYNFYCEADIDNLKERIRNG